MTPLRIGIIGCGRMGRERATACRALGQTIALLYDTDPSRAAALQEACPSSQIATDFRPEAWRALDAVFLCTPPAVRAEYLEVFIALGLPFLVEKPIARSADEARPIALALARRPLVHAVGYMNRCRGSVRQARALVAGTRVLGAAVHWLGRAYAVPWWPDPRLSGGPINEQTTHLVDLCRFVIGEVVAVHAVAGPPLESGLEGSTAAVALRFATGEAATIFYSCGNTDAAKHIGFRILTDRGAVELSGWDFTLTPRLPGAPAVTPDTIPIFTVETGQFLRAVDARDPAAVSCTYADALRTQVVVDAVRQSLRTARPVQLEATPEEVLS